MPRKTMTIPEHFQISKEKAMKGWSYPITTTDLLKSLDETLEEHIDLYYRNASNEKRDGAWRIILIAEHYSDARGDDFPDFYIKIESVPSKYREKARKLFKEQILPCVAKWMKKARSTDTRCNMDRTLKVIYRRHDRFWPNGEIEIEDTEGIARHWGDNHKETTLLKIEETCIG